MKFHKLCEYLNDIGLLQYNNIKIFLQIYSQKSLVRVKDESQKYNLALFSYLSLFFEDKSNLYSLCKNIINSFNNNQIIKRYKAIESFKNIIKPKLYNIYYSFFTKINHFMNKNDFVPKEKNKMEYSKFNQNPTQNIKNEKIQSPINIHLYSSNYDKYDYKNKISIFQFDEYVESKNLYKIYNPNITRNKSNNCHYDFYDNQKNHIKRVEGKIIKLKIDKCDEISKECTFVPKINKSNSMKDMKDINKKKRSLTVQNNDENYMGLENGKTNNNDELNLKMTNFVCLKENNDENNSLEHSKCQVEEIDNKIKEDIPKVQQCEDNITNNKDSILDINNINIQSSTKGKNVENELEKEEEKKISNSEDKTEKIKEVNTNKASKEIIEDSNLSLSLNIEELKKKYEDKNLFR